MFTSSPCPFVTRHTPRATRHGKYLPPPPPVPPQPHPGIPFTVKDNFSVAGSGCSAASHMLRGYTSPYTSPCVQAVLEAGAVLVGRTNMDEFGMGSSTAAR
jgi:Asp-tRNA(Asn)/Glu-tRNA(Gln) amidotransferase A subunit family amidase